MKQEKSCGCIVLDKRTVLLIKHNSGHWDFPKGHVEGEESEVETAIREVKEETGLDAKAIRLIAVQDRNKHNRPVYAYGVWKVFVLCERIGGEFAENSETTEIKYFGLDELPQNLAEEKCTKEQIEMCFQAKDDANWQVQFD